MFWDRAFNWLEMVLITLSNLFIRLLTIETFTSQSDFWQDALAMNIDYYDWVLHVDASPQNSIHYQDIGSRGWCINVGHLLAELIIAYRSRNSLTCTRDWMLIVWIDLITPCSLGTAWRGGGGGVHTDRQAATRNTTEAAQHSLSQQGVWASFGQPNP